MTEEFIKVIADNLFANTSMKELSAKRIYEIAKDMAPFVLKGAKMELMKCAKLSGWVARDEEPVTNLEEAAQKAYPGNIHKQSIFIHGANWKKQHMMKDAVECKVECDVHFGMIVPKEAVKEAVNNSSVLYPGEKVKLIIIKEE